MSRNTDLTRVNPCARNQRFNVTKNARDLDTIRRTFKADAPSVLSAVRDFLPRLAAANVDIQRQLEQDPESVCIENVEDGEPHVEMSLALVENSDEDSDLSDSEDDDVVQLGEVTVDNIKLPNAQPRKNKVVIECRSEDEVQDAVTCDNKTDQASIEQTLCKSPT